MNECFAPSVLKLTSCVSVFLYMSALLYLRLCLFVCSSLPLLSVYSSVRLLRSTLIRRHRRGDVELFSSGGEGGRCCFCCCCCCNGGWIDGGWIDASIYVAVLHLRHPQL